MERIELKFYIENKNFSLIRENFLLKKLYPDRIISTIYYDTNDFKFFSDSEEGLYPRIKVRKRSYNQSANYVYEIKKSEAYTRSKIVEENITDLKKFLIKNSINFFLTPKVKIIYRRKYFESIYGRVTVDYGIKYQKINFYEKSFIEKNENKIILEIKNSISNDKIDILQKINMKNERISKYCEAIKKLY